MVEILGKEYKLNQIVTIGWLNKRGCWEIVTGRIFDYSNSNNYIWIDSSYDYMQLEDTIKIDTNKIKYVKKMQNNMWR